MILDRFVDERFLAHRRASTSVAGMVGAALAGGLFIYQIYADHVIRWDLFAILATMVVVKLALMAWHFTRE